MSWMRMMAAMGMGLALLGCAADRRPAEEELLTEPSPTQAILDAQVRAGAAADPTLYRVHFDGTALNALGRAKVALIAGQGAVVYVDVAELADVRSGAVREHLKLAGMAGVEVKVGRNPEAGHAPSRPQKTEAVEMPVVVPVQRAGNR